MQPLVSIITVTKNCNSTIARTLKSVAAIKSADIQYIVVDGKSDDGTLATIATYGDLVDILVSEDDTGIYNAMNKGVQLASGKYIQFINGDDELLADGFIQAKSVLKSTDADVFCCSSRIGSDGGSAEILLAQPWRLFFYNSVPHPSSYVLGETLKRYGFREDLKIASDYDLFLRLLLFGKKFTVADFVTAIHHRGGLSSNIDLSQMEIELIKRERLGWVYYIISTLQWVYRSIKKLVS